MPLVNSIWKKINRRENGVSVQLLDSGFMRGVHRLVLERVTMSPVNLLLIWSVRTHTATFLPN